MPARLFLLALFLAAHVHAGAEGREMKKPVPVLTDDPAVFAPTLSVRLRFLNERINPQEKDRGKLDAAAKDLGDIEKDLAALAQGKSILRAGRELLMGFHSDLDDSSQPYSLWIPDEYDGAKPFPLVVLLHGQGMFNPLQCKAVAIGRNIVVAPQGRGGMDYMYVGEGDVLRVIDEVQRMLKVDPNRIYLAGASMGGSGSWHLASHFPDRFAGIMPLCGNTDINVWQELWHWRTPQDSPLAKARHFLREDTCAATYAENLGNVGIVSLQGTADPIVNQLHARKMSDALKACGHPNYQVYLLPFVTHGISADYSLGLQNFVRDPKPKHVHYKTAWLKNPGAYWLRITGIEKRLKHAVIDGVADPEKKTIEIKTDNVTEIRIERAGLPFSGLPAQIVIDGAKFGSPLDHSEFFGFAKDPESGWKEHYSSEKKVAFFDASGTRYSASLRKRAALEGPVEHAFMSRFVIVSSDVKEKPTELALAADNAARDFVEQWKTRFAVPCRAKRANEISEQDIADSNLILIGVPETNSLIKKMQYVFPLMFFVSGDLVNVKAGDRQVPYDSTLGITLGDKHYTGAGGNLGAIFCYPNLLNPQRYVVLVSGTTPRAYADIFVRFGNWFDWVPYDSRKHYDFAIFDDLTNGRHPESFLVWGFFGEDWQLNKETTFEAVPTWRGKALPRVFPTVNIGKLDKRPESVYLDEAFTKWHSANKEYLERNRTLDGTTLQLRGQDFARGLCARFPCTIVFDCAGFGRFKATAGVAWDGKTEPSEDRKRSEKVKVTVQADGKTVFEAFDRTYKTPPCEIDVELGGAKTVTLSATGGLSWLNGSFIWADARLEGDDESKKSKGKSQKAKAPTSKK